ncbi:MAG: metal ABC transporter ATP-binding protein [Eubacteriales bacterium]|nr:metal ABC transporter ATP-binding protein [Eubacteriales bacterium]
MNARLSNNLSDKKAAITVNNVTMRYQEAPVVQDLSFNVEPGTMVALVGPNGAGKSTLFKGMLGLHPLVSGEVLFNGEPLNNVRRQIAYLPQKSEVNWDFPLTVGELAVMGRYPRLSWFKRPRKQDKEIAAKALEMVEMTEFKHRQISELSGGQKQRAFLARALAQEADYYFLDEAFQGIDVRSSEILWEILEDLRAAGKAIVIVHHDLEAVDQRFDQAVLLHRKLIAAGDPATTLTKENLNTAYGGPQS